MAYRVLLLAATVIALSAATGDAAVRSCGLPVASELKPRGSAVFAVRDRLVVCRDGRRRRGADAAGAQRAHAQGAFLGVVRRSRGGCLRVEAFHLRRHRTVSAARLGCGGRVLSHFVTSSGALAVQVAADRRVRILSVVHSRQRVLETDASRRPVDTAFFDDVGWTTADGARRSALLRRRGCTPQGDTEVLRDGPLRAWNEQRPELDSTSTLVLHCDVRDGVVRIADKVYGTPYGCGSLFGRLLQDGRLVTQRTEYSGRCGDALERLRVFDLASGRRIAGVSCFICSVRQLRLTPAGSPLVGAVGQPGLGGRAVASIRLGTPRGTRTLDEGPDVDADSLALTGATATWTTAGQLRSATTP